MFQRHAIVLNTHFIPYLRPYYSYTPLQKCELPGNYPVFTVVMVIYTFVRRISIITLPPEFFKRFYIHIH